MKYLLFLVFILCQINLVSQENVTCLPEGIFLYTQEDVDDFSVEYPYCTEIEGNLIVSGSDEITSLEGLSQLTTIGGMLRIYSCKELLDLSGLENITSVGGDLDIYLWPSATSIMTSLTGLNNVDSVGGGLNVSGTDVLCNLEGLESLTYVGGYLNIGGNDILVDMSGLDNLSYVGEDVWIGVNAAITSLHGLENLTLVLEAVEIYGNVNLLSLSGIDNILAEYIDGYFCVRYNSSLTTCEVKSFCDYLGLPDSYAEAFYNGIGCSSNEEVESACEAVFSEIKDISGEIVLIPNPASEFIYFENISERNLKSIAIYNLSGEKVLEVCQFTNRIDISSINSGLYVVELYFGDYSVRQKLIIQ
jgi:hypothetical protein